jgi:hypothetical protein
MTAILQRTPEITEINRLHAEILTSAQNAIQKAIRVGEILTAEKAKVKHGDWGLWIEVNLDFSQDTAERWMGLYKNRNNSNSARVRNLTDAYKVLAQNDLPELPVLDEIEERTRLKARLKELDEKQSHQARKKPVRKKRIPSSPARERCPVCERIMTKAILARIKKKKSDGQSS